MTTDATTCDICGRSRAMHMEIMGVGRVCPAQGFTFRPRRDHTVELTALRTQIAAMREALEPFARAVGYANDLNKAGPDDAPRHPKDFVTYGEFVNARAALNPQGEKL